MTVKQLSSEAIIRVLQTYGITASARLCDQIRTYIDLLLRWNQKTSLTTVTDQEQVLRFHFGESILAVPIRMVCDDLSVILIESNQKKATFLAEVVRELQLQNVEVRRSRME